MLGQYIDRRGKPVTEAEIAGARQAYDIALRAWKEREASWRRGGGDPKGDPHNPRPTMPQFAFIAANPGKRQLKAACRRASNVLGRKLTKRERKRAAEIIAQHLAQSNG